jgi:hypothetical protein
MLLALYTSGERSRIVGGRFLTPGGGYVSSSAIRA